MRRSTGFFIIVMFILEACLFAQTIEKESLKKGVQYLETKVYTKEENTKLLALYEGLRVADVSDGMDRVGLPGIGLVDPAIHAQWKDNDKLTHIFRGIAITVRYVPAQVTDRPAAEKAFSEWEGYWYWKLSSEPFTELIETGSVVVIDDVEEKDIGTIGSYNILEWHRRGAVGVVTDACSRDTDEIEKERVPLYLRHTGRGIRPGRNVVESVNHPVVIGGVLVCPGDVVVADGDGVIVVPRAVAEEVAKHAREILDADKEGRRALYEKMGIPLDATVK